MCTGERNNYGAVNLFQEQVLLAEIGEKAFVMFG